MNRKIAIPKLPHAFFRWYCRKDRYEELHGDLEELFYERAAESGLATARLFYWFNVIRCFQPYAWKKSTRQTNAHFMMFNNYFKISIRGLMKNPLNSFINVAGLAMAIGICIFAYGFARWTYSTDQFHKNKNEVYLATFFANRDGKEQQFGQTPRPLGEMLRADFAQIKKVCRVEDRSVVVKYEDNVFHERVRYTDPEFLDMFTFPLKWGTSHSLADPNSIIISEPMSIKYFGEENPIGQGILVIFDKERSKAFKISGVAKAFPKARTISFDFLINFENLKISVPVYDFQDWKSMVNATLIQIDNRTDLAAVENGMKKYISLQNKAAEEDWAIGSFTFEPLATLHERSENIRDDISRSSKNNYITVVYLVFISVFLLALACFNYINIAIASAAKRLKEIGVRKSIGADRRIVIVQFLSENMVITFFALILGLILGMTVFIPGFEAMWDFNMDFRLDDAKLWIYLPAILFLTSIASGIYPSVYISKFNVTEILKGSVKFGNRNPLTKTFLCIQLIMACIFITNAVVMSQNSSYMAKRPWGYNQEQGLYAIVHDQSEYDKVHALMVQDPDVLSISGSKHHLGKSNATAVLHFPDHEYEVDQFSVDAGYFTTMGLELKEGRTFHSEEGSDKYAVVVNSVLASNLGPGSAIGQQFRIDSVQYEIIGVLNEFHSYSFTRSSGHHFYRCR